MGSEAPHAVYDASVLFPFQTAHILAFTAVVGAVRARWTRDIQREWVERSLEHYPDLQRASIEGRCRAMDRALPGALVTGYEARISDLVFPDLNDRHVVAAALECGATLIVTRDKTHFNRRSLEPHGLMAVDPDDLLCERLEDAPELMIDAVDRARSALTKTRPDFDAYCELLVKTGLGQFAEAFGRRRPSPP